MMSVDNAVADVASATKKFFKRVLPIMLVMLVCNQLNRSNIGYAQDHLQADVGIGAAAYGFGAGLFFIAYAIFELPSNVMMEKYGAKVWLARIMVSWGIVSFLMAFVQNETMFYVLRFLLGAAEAGFFPAVIFYFARWVPAGQRGKATAIFIAGSSIAAAISGPIAGMLLSLQGAFGLRGWQWLFGFEGVLSILVGITVFFLLDAKIKDAKWLTASEKDALSQAISAEDAQHATADGEKINRWKMLLNPQILLLCGIYFSVQLSIYANTFWLPSIIKQIPGTTDLTVGFPLLDSVDLRGVRHVLRGQVAGQSQVQAPVAGGRTPGRRCGHVRGSDRFPGHGAGVPGHRRHGLQERFPAVLDHPAVRAASPGAGSRHRHHQLAGKPRRVRCPVRLRHHQGADRQRHPGPLRARRRLHHRRRPGLLPEGTPHRDRAGGRGRDLSVEAPVPSRA
jgi:MFS family permease